MTQHPCLASLRSQQPCMTKDSLTMGGRGLLYCLSARVQVPHTLTCNSSHSQVQASQLLTLITVAPAPLPQPILYHLRFGSKAHDTELVTGLYSPTLPQQTYSNTYTSCHSQSVWPEVARGRSVEFPLNVNNNHRPCSPNLLNMCTGWFYVNLTEAGITRGKETSMEKSTPDRLVVH